MTTLLITALSLLATVAGPAPSPIDVTQVTEADELTVTMETEGCYHSGRYEFHFRFLGSGAEVEVSQWRAKEKKWHYLHRRSLTSKQLGQIQQSLIYYRKPDSAGCTTVERLRFDLMHRGQPKASESYVDDSCASVNDARLFSWIALL